MNTIASYIDHTLLRADAQKQDIDTLCEQAKQYGFASVCVNGYYTACAAKALSATPIKVCTVVGFPLGAVPSSVKAFETKQALADGATEIDMVLNIGALLAGDYDYVEEDIRAVVNEAHPTAIVKVILETCLLSEEQKIKACEISVKAGADFVKTSTGFSSGGATVADIALIKQSVAGSARVKASGGIKSKEDALKMIQAGADRIGTSNGVVIVNE